MAKQVLTNASVVLNEVDISDHVRSVTITSETPEVDVTAMGAAYQEFEPGIPDATIELELYQDYAAGSVNATLGPLYRNQTAFVIDIKPSAAATSATNPLQRMTGKLYSYSPLTASVGEANMMTATIRNASQDGITEHTTDPT